MNNESENIERSDPLSQENERAILITDDMLADKGGGFPIDFERGMSYYPKLTLLLILICAAIFVWELVRGALDSQQAIIAAGALHRDLVLKGEIWRVVSSMFLHGSADHLIGNCIVLYILGVACEHAFSLGQTAVIYFLGGICGALLSLAAQPGPSVGASGAIFAVLGGVIIFLYKHQKYFFVRDKRIGFVLSVWALYTIAGGFLTPYVDNFAHIGGFLGGCATAYFLKPALLEAADMDRKPL